MTGKTKSLVLISFFTALTAVGAFIRIPTPLCPVTLQILFTTLSGVILGSKGAVSVIVYIILGLLGFPLFSGGGGIGYILHPTFGFLVGMAVGAYVTGRICSGNIDSKRLIMGCICGLVPIYTIGTMYCLLISCVYLKNSSALAVIHSCLIPLPKDVLFCVFAAYIGKKILRHHFT